MGKGVSVMRIILNDFQEVNTFCKGIEFFDGEIDMVQNRENSGRMQKINARSFLGICSLDLNRPIDVKITTNDKGVEEDFYNYIKKWETVD